MAKILLLTKSDSYATKTAAALVEGGHTVTTANDEGGAALDAALDAAQPDLLMTCLPWNTATFRTWLRSKWDQGIPVIAGGAEAGSSSSTLHHAVESLGILTSVITRNGDAGSQYMNDGGWGHPLMEGATSIMVTAGQDMYVNSYSGAVVYGEAVGRNATSGGSYYMVITEEGTPLSNGVAPANAAWIGWLRGYSYDYTTEGKRILNDTVEWAATAPVVEAPVSFAATPATATANALNATVTTETFLSINPQVESFYGNASAGNAQMQNTVYRSLLMSPVPSHGVSVITGEGPLVGSGLARTGSTLSGAAVPATGIHGGAGWLAGTQGGSWTSGKGDVAGSSPSFTTLFRVTDALAPGAGETLLSFYDSPFGPEYTDRFAATVKRSADGANMEFKVRAQRASAYGGAVAEETVSMPMSDFTSGQWHHLGIISTGPHRGLFIDGVKKTSIASEYLAAAARASYGGTSSGSIPGLVLDEAAFYLNLLTPSQIEDQAEFIGFVNADKTNYATPLTSTATMPSPVVIGVGNYAFAATATSVTAQMLEAIGEGAGSTRFFTDAATASGEMLEGYLPNVNPRAAVAAANGLMGAAWFRSGRRVAVEAATATAEALTIESVVPYRNIIVEAAVAEADGGNVVDPLEVNRDLVDPYFLRLTGRELDGTRTWAGTWYRFNERSGSKVHVWNPATGAIREGSNINGGDLVGAYQRAVPGPNGRRATRIDNAGLNVGQMLFDNPSTGSIEFTLRVAPGHVGRMDLFNGFNDHYMHQASTDAKKNIHVSVRDGKLYGIGKFGGTTNRRIDDGKWHHVVLTNSASGVVWFIDGVRDRTFTYHENAWGVQRAPEVTSNFVGVGIGSPETMFGQDTNYPFKGEILEVINRGNNLSGSQVTDLYLDMFGYKATRAGIVGAAVGAMGDAKVETNMKRMLVLSFGNVPHHGTMQQTDNNKFGVLVNEEYPQNLTEMFVHGQNGDLDIGNYLMTWQNVTGPRAGDAYYELMTARGTPVTGNVGEFIDENTGRRRLIDIHKDVNLDDFDVIFVQGYTNPSMNTQAQRDLYEPFLNSLNKALVDGKKLWITDPYLAADLGWVTAVDQVPVIAIGNDVRSYDIAPFPEAVGAGTQPMPRPADGSMPVLPKGLPQGSQHGLYNLWRWDIHHNTGYRVVNEIDGMTNLPSWEVDEMYMRDRRVMLPDNWEWETWGYKLANRSGEDFEWKVKRMNNYIGTDLDDGSGVVFDNIKPSTGTGLKAGDEFYDYVWYDYGYKWFKYASSANYMTARKATLNRATGTWAIPMGHLRVGTAVSTFRSTMHDDFGNEVPNPYRNHIRNAVVRPGDRLPDGRKVMGYALMEFAMRPDVNYLSGRGIEKQLTLPVDEYTAPEDIVQKTSDYILPETPYSFDWDYAHHGRVLFSSGGTVTLVSYTSISRAVTRKGATKISTAWIKRVENLPSAQRKIEWYPIRIVPHLDWVSRGLAWLFTVDKVEAEYANYAATAATATGRITGAQIDTEYDNTVTVGAAKASANIVAPAEAQVKEVSVFAAPATATGKMNGIAGGYKAEPAQAFVTMPQNVLRPLDIEEVLFFTVTMNQKTINLRMEEN